MVVHFVEINTNPKTSYLTLKRIYCNTHDDLNYLSDRFIFSYNEDSITQFSYNIIDNSSIYSISTNLEYEIDTTNKTIKFTRYKKDKGLPYITINLNNVATVSQAIPFIYVGDIGLDFKAASYEVVYNNENKDRVVSTTYMSPYGSLKGKKEEAASWGLLKVNEVCYNNYSGKMKRVKGIFEWSNYNGNYIYNWSITAFVNYEYVDNNGKTKSDQKFVGSLTVQDSLKDFAIEIPPLDGVTLSSPKCYNDANRDNGGEIIATCKFINYFVLSYVIKIHDYYGNGSSTSSKYYIEGTNTSYYSNGQVDRLNEKVYLESDASGPLLKSLLVFGGNFYYSDNKYYSPYEVTVKVENS